MPKSLFRNIFLCIFAKNPKRITLYYWYSVISLVSFKIRGFINWLIIIVITWSTASAVLRRSYLFLMSLLLQNYMVYCFGGIKTCTPKKPNPLNLITWSTASAVLRPNSSLAFAPNKNYMVYCFGGIKTNVPRVIAVLSHKITWFTASAVLRQTCFHACLIKL